jgi:hypothetical protein
MAAGGTTRPTTTTQGYGGYPAAIPPSPPQGFTQPPPPHNPPSGTNQVQRPRRGRTLMAGIGIATAVALSAAALVVSLVNTGGDAPPASPQPPATPSSTAPTGSTAADKALCETIAPLIKESADRGKAFVALGHTGTPERDAGIAPFLSDTMDWVRRAEDALSAHPSPGYLSRSLQRYIDDRRSYSASLRPGPETEADAAAWNDSLVAAGGSYQVCGDLGVPLW